MISDTLNYFHAVCVHADGDPTVGRAVVDLIGKLGRVAFPPVCDTVIVPVIETMPLYFEACLVRGGC